MVHYTGKFATTPCVFHSFPRVFIDNGPNTYQLFSFLTYFISLYQLYRGLIVIFPYLQGNSVKFTLLFAACLLPLKNNFNGLQYCIFIHTYKVL
jgi:hypothetical protein